GLNLSDLDVEHETSKFDLALFMGETEAGLVAHWVYKTCLFSAGTIARIARHFETLLGSIVAHPDTSLDSLEMLTAPEREQQRSQEKERQEAQITRLRSARRQSADTAEPVRLLDAGRLPANGNGEK